MAEEKPKGYLVITVIEAAGKNQSEQYIWDSAEFEGYVKIELRGGSRNVKVATKKAAVAGTAILWNESLTLDVLEGANELRVMLCRDKLVQSSSGQKRGTSVIAACGIFVSDILDAVPIDKYFELFKPSAGGEGGFIRLGLNYTTDPKAVPHLKGLQNGLPAAGGAAAAGSKKRKGGGWWKVPLVLLSLGLAAAGGYYGYKQYEEHKDKDKGAGKDKKGSTSAKADTKDAKQK